MICAINYDLKRPGQNYPGRARAVKSCGAWWALFGVDLVG